MALESGTYISQLNSSNPTTSDDVAEGDDHLRLIKAVLKNQFSGLSGTTAISSSEAELNIMDGGTAATSTTLVNADRLVVNDNGTMVQVDLSDVKTYLNSAGYVTDDPTALAIALG